MGVGNASESVNILHINLITAIFIAVLRPPGEQPFYQKNTLSFRRKSSLPGKDSLIRKKCFLSGRPFNQDKTFYRKHCCGTGMFIPDPRSRFSYIPDPGTRIPEPGSRTPDLGSNKNKKQQGDYFLPYLFRQPKFHKIDYFIFLKGTKKLS